MRLYPQVHRTAARALAGAALLGCLAAIQSSAASFTIFSEDFESYTGAATSFADTTNANPPVVGAVVADDNPLGTANGSGVQLVNYLAHSGNNSILLRPASEIDFGFNQARSGTNYQIDFWTYAVRPTTAADRNFYVIIRGEGADSNGDDWMAYRVDRVTNSTALFYYDGVGPSAANWFAVGKDQTVDTWQHHRIIVRPNVLTADIYVDDMVTPALAGVEIARPDSSVPIALRVLNEGNSANDGHFYIDDITVTVDGSIDLSTPFTEGFESYPARTSPEDDADPAGPWITAETDGNGSGKVPAPGKVQVVDGTAHTGTKSLKLEAGQRAGVTFAWGTPPQSDVQITWWARVPEAIQATPTSDAVLLRMSLYGSENYIQNLGTGAGDDALLGWGIRRQTSTNTGTSTSLLYFSSSWFATAFNYTPDVWEQYRLITHTSQGRYTILRNPSGANPEVIIDRAPMVGTATNWSPVFALGFSSSNGTNHPPVYVDDIEVRSLVSIPDPVSNPYTVVANADRFTNVTILTVPGVPIGDIAVDPRDNTTILLAVDSQDAGGIYKANKVGTGNWVIDPTPVVTGIDRPSGLIVANDGTIWWTHDFSMSLMRLKAPWASNTPENVVTNFGSRLTDDDPIDLVVTPSTFNGTLGSPGMIAVADRGSDGDDTNAVYLVAANAEQGTNNNLLIYDPHTSATTILGDNLNAVTALQASGEVVTLSQNGYITAIDGNGTYRYILPTTLWTDFTTPIAGGAIAADPTTGRIWIAEDLLNEVWSISPDGSSADRKEFSFALNNPFRPDTQLDVHEPGMTFAPNGSFAVLTDGSTVNGGGRIIIFHNDFQNGSMTVPNFKVTDVSKSALGVKIVWQSAGGVKYTVQRGTDLGNAASFQDLATDVYATEYLDKNPPASGAFYRVIAQP